MRHPKTFKFLCAVGVLSGGLIWRLIENFPSWADRYPEFGNWGEGKFYEWAPTLKNPWFVGLLVIISGCYLASVIFTYRMPKPQQEATAILNCDKILEARVDQPMNSEAAVSLLAADHKQAFDIESQPDANVDDFSLAALANEIIAKDRYVTSVIDWYERVETSLSNLKLELQKWFEGPEFSTTWQNQWRTIESKMADIESDLQNFSFLPDHLISCDFERLRVAPYYEPENMNMMMEEPKNIYVPEHNPKLHAFMRQNLIEYDRRLEVLRNVRDSEIESLSGMRLELKILGG